MKKEYIISCCGFSFVVPDKKTANWINKEVDRIFNSLPEEKQNNTTYNSLYYWFATEMNLTINS